MPTTPTSAWLAKAARALQDIARNLDRDLRYTVCRDLVAKAFGYEGDHELTQLVARRKARQHPFDHELLPAERAEREARQTALLAAALELESDQARGAWLAWRPTAHLREETIARLPPMMGPVKMSEIGEAPGGRMDAGFHLTAKALAAARGQDWSDRAVRREAMALTAAMERAGIALDRALPHLMHPTEFVSRAQARTYLRAAGFMPSVTPGGKEVFFLNVRPHPDAADNGWIRVHAAQRESQVSYWTDSNVLDVEVAPPFPRRVRIVIGDEIKTSDTPEISVIFNRATRDFAEAVRTGDRNSDLVMRDYLIEDAAEALVATCKEFAPDAAKFEDAMHRDGPGGIHALIVVEDQIAAEIASIPAAIDAMRSSDEWDPRVRDGDAATAALAIVNEAIDVAKAIWETPRYKPIDAPAYFAEHSDTDKLMTPLPLYRRAGGPPVYCLRLSESVIFTDRSGADVKVDKGGVLVYRDADPIGIEGVSATEFAATYSPCLEDGTAIPEEIWAAAYAEVCEDAKETAILFGGKGRTDAQIEAITWREAVRMMRQAEAAEAVEADGDDPSP